MRLAYIQGVVGPDGTPEYLSQGDLAHRFNIPIGSIAKVCTEEGWMAQRVEHQRRLSSETQRKCIARASDRLASVAAKSAETAERILDNIMYLMPAPPPGKDVTFEGPSGDNIERAERLSVVYRNILQGTRLLSSGSPTPTNTAGDGAGSEGLTAQQRDVALAAARSVLERNQSPAAVAGVPGED